MKIFKKILIITGISIAITLLTQNVTGLALQIDESYRPSNMAFNLDYDSNTPTDNTIIIIQIIAGALLYFAAPIAVIFIAYSGLQMVIGGDDSDNLESAKNNLKWSIIGLLVIILSYSIVRIVIDVTLKSGEAVGS